MWTRIFRPSQALRLVRLNSTASLKDLPVPVPKKVPKKKGGQLALRRSTQKDVRTTASVIVSLLSKYSNRQVEPSELEQYVHPVTSITVGESIDFDKVSHILQFNGLHHRVLVDGEVINWSVTRGTQRNDLTILANGTLVGWGLTEEQMMKAYVPTIMGAVVERYSPESEEMDFVEVDGVSAEENGSSFMQGDVLVLQGHDADQKQLEMAAFAMGLSRSTRLSILEESLDKYIQISRENSFLLSEGVVARKESSIVKIIGRLFLIRAQLNLYSELIETPDLYWSEPVLEKIYEQVSRRLDILLRISIMNRKLDYVTEEQRALLSVMSEKKSTRLEWIIIVLIMVEVCFETVHFIEKYRAAETGETLARASAAQRPITRPDNA